MPCEEEERKGRKENEWAKQRQPPFYDSSFFFFSLRCFLSAFSWLTSRFFCVLLQRKNKWVTDSLFLSMMLCMFCVCVYSLNCIVLWYCILCLCLSLSLHSFWSLFFYFFFSAGPSLSLSSILHSSLVQADVFDVTLLYILVAHSSLISLYSVSTSFLLQSLRCCCSTSFLLHPKASFHSLPSVTDFFSTRKAFLVQSHLYWKTFLQVSLSQLLFVSWCLCCQKLWGKKWAENEWGRKHCMREKRNMFRHQRKEMKQWEFCTLESRVCRDESVDVMVVSFPGLWLTWVAWMRVQESKEEGEEEERRREKK